MNITSEQAMQNLEHVVSEFSTSGKNHIILAHSLNTLRMAINELNELKAKANEKRVEPTPSNVGVD